MDDASALALCCFEEANLEPDDGLAAVARVILNRTRLKYQSDGTIQGTIFHGSAFSWTEYEMVGGVYTKVAVTPAEVAVRAANLLAKAKAYVSAWKRAWNLSGGVQTNTYVGIDYAKLTDATVLYLNPAILAHLPAWADPAKEVCRIGHHVFYHA